MKLKECWRRLLPRPDQRQGKKRHPNRKRPQTNHGTTFTTCTLSHYMKSDKYKLGRMEDSRRGKQSAREICTRFSFISSNGGINGRTSEPGQSWWCNKQPERSTRRDNGNFWGARDFRMIEARLLLLDEVPVPTSPSPPPSPPCNNDQFNPLGVKLRFGY